MIDGRHYHAINISSRQSFEEPASGVKSPTAPGIFHSCSAQRRYFLRVDYTEYKPVAEPGFLACGKGFS